MDAAEELARPTPAALVYCPALPKSTRKVSHIGSYFATIAAAMITDGSLVVVGLGCCSARVAAIPSCVDMKANESFADTCLLLAVAGRASLLLQLVEKQML